MHICTVLRQGNEAKVYAASLGMLSAYALLKRSRNGGRERGPGTGAGNGGREREPGPDFGRAISARGAH